MTIEVKNIKGDSTGRTVDLDPSIFGVEPNDHAIYLAVTAELSNKRHGTHSTLERSDVSGTTKKPWKQKGTGGARAGSVKTPLWPGGGIVFGPRPHLYKKSVNAKVKRLAKRSALTRKAAGQRIVVVEDFHTLCAEAPRTREVARVLGSLGLAARAQAEEGKRSKRIQKVLMLVNKAEAVKDERERRIYDNFRKSCRNIPGLRISVVKDISTYDIMNADYLLFHESALKSVGSAFGSAAN
jgi:large subunit ribosomal protein L4